MIYQTGYDDVVTSNNEEVMRLDDIKVGIRDIATYWPCINIAEGLNPHKRFEALGFFRLKIKMNLTDDCGLCVNVCM